MAIIYIAGRITGVDPKECYETFEKAELELNTRGHISYNPRRLVDQRTDRSYNEQLRDALYWMLCSDAIYMLPSWQDSVGARIEHAIAVEKRIPIYYTLETVPEVSK